MGVQNLGCYKPENNPWETKRKMMEQEILLKCCSRKPLRQRNEMMDKFSQILQRLPTGEASSSSGHATLFKVQVNFDIPLFEGPIYVDVVDKWLNMLEGYFWVHNFSNRENINFALLKFVPHLKDWWDTYSEQRDIEEPAIFVVSPTWDFFRNSIK
jgi:hypothetical protein